MPKATPLTALAAFDQMMEEGDIVNLNIGMNIFVAPLSDAALEAFVRAYGALEDYEDDGDLEDSGDAEPDQDEGDGEADDEDGDPAEPDHDDEPSLCGVVGSGSTHMDPFDRELGADDLGEPDHEGERDYDSEMSLGWPDNIDQKNSLITQAHNVAQGQP